MVSCKLAAAVAGWGWWGGVVCAVGWQMMGWGNAHQYVCFMVAFIVHAKAARVYGGVATE